MTTKKKKDDDDRDDPEIQCFKSEHWTINHRNGFNSVSRYSKTFHIPDEELVELAQLLEKWKEREK